MNKMLKSQSTTRNPALKLFKGPQNRVKSAPLEPPLIKHIFHLRELKESMFRISLIICLLIAGLSTAHAQSFTPTEEQLELFQRLSPEQQEALAKKYGLNLEELGIADPDATKDKKSSGAFMLPRPGQDKKTDDEELIDGEEEDQKEEDEPEELKPFGYDLFAGQPTTFAPITKAPVPAHYVLGLGDKILVNLYGKENQQYELEINRQGQLEIPGLSPILVAGLTYSEAKSFVKSKVEEQIIGVNANISFGELGAIQIFILGDAYVPGSYTLSSLSTITHALFASGGIKENGSLRNIQLKRAGKLITTLDLYDLLLKGDTKDDLILQSGDVVFIPSVGQRATVSGAVNRPAIYEVSPNESFSELLEIAGGAANEAYLHKVNAYQFSRGTRRVVNVDLSNNADLQRTIGSVTEMHVPTISNRLDNAIQLLGEVSRPGYYQWYEGVTLRSLIDSETGFFTEHSDINYGLLIRTTQTGIETRQFSPAKLLMSEVEDQPLMPNDKLFVFSTNTKTKQLLSFEELSGLESKQDLIKERVELQIEEQFFWDLYAAMEDPDDEKEDSETDLPSLYELENESFSELVEKYKIYRWDTSARHYLLWPAYKLVLDKNRIGQTLPLIEISGNVRYPGTYPMSDGGTLEQALDAAGGLTNIASPIVKVSRETGTGVQQFDVHVDQAQNFAINGKDKVAVFMKPEANEIVRVEIKGEVMFPGVYTVKRGEMLSSLIEKAGGLTKYAHADGAVFTRLALKEKEKNNLKDLAEELRKQLAAKRITTNNIAVATGDVDYSELQEVMEDLSTTEAVGRMVIDLPNLLTGAPGADIELIRGDVLAIPPMSQTVSVVGEVFLPTSHRYNAGLTVQEYLARSGGIKQLGDEDSVFVVQANGAVIKPTDDFWFSGDATTLKPGDTIVVPLDASPIDDLTLWTSITQIMGQIGLAIAAVTRI